MSQGIPCQCEECQKAREDGRPEEAWEYWHPSMERPREVSPLAGQVNGCLIVLLGFFLLLVLMAR